MLSSTNQPCALCMHDVDPSYCLQCNRIKIANGEPGSAFFCVHDSCARTCHRCKAIQAMSDTDEEPKHAVTDKRGEANSCERLKPKRLSGKRCVHGLFVPLWHCKKCKDDRLLKTRAELNASTVGLD